MNNTDKMSNFSILTIPYKSLFSTNETALKQSKLIFRMEIIPENSEPKGKSNLIFKEIYIVITYSDIILHFLIITIFSQDKKRFLIFFFG